MRTTQHSIRHAPKHLSRYVMWLVAVVGADDSTKVFGLCTIPGKECHDLSVSNASKERLIVIAASLLVVSRAHKALGCSCALSKL